MESPRDVLQVVLDEKSDEFREFTSEAELDLAGHSALKLKGSPTKSNIEVMQNDSRKQ